MRTIFVNEKPLFINEKPFKADKDTKIIGFEPNKSSFDELLELLTESEISSLCIYFSDEKLLWKAFKSHFKIVKAAGGLVINKQHRILFIKRWGRWDLPKGKIKKKEKRKEAALREIEEECNLSALKIIAPLKTTYHVYFMERPILKVVYWYEVFCENEDQTLIPQLEEGIEEVVWKERSQLKQVLKNTYKNIHLILTDFFAL